MEIKEERHGPLSNGFLVIGFPGIGHVGSLIGHFLVEYLKMRHVASIHDLRFPPTALIRRGKALSPIRFYSTEEACGLDGTCRRLVVLVGDVLLEPELFGELADTALRWGKSKGVRQVAVLEGYVLDQPSNGRRTKVRAAGSLRNAIRTKQWDVEPIDEGFVTSPGAAFLLAADRLNLDCVALFADAKGENPDTQAASRLLRRVDPMIPPITWDPKSLSDASKSMRPPYGSTVNAN